MAIGGSQFIQSGIKGAGFGAMGFFSAGVLHLGSAATVASLGTAAVAGFAGGLALYAPAVALRLVMHHSGFLENASRGVRAAVDLTLLALTMPVGAWMLGLAVQPFIMAAAVALVLYVLFNFTHLALKLHHASRESYGEISNNTVGAAIRHEALFSPVPFNESTACFSLGSFC